MCAILSMTLHAQPLHETYYDILNVKEDASFEEIRQSYRSALLQSHPDKLQKSSNFSSSGEDPEGRFVKVQKAWETLSDSNSRVLYDHKLRSLRSDVLVVDEVALSDMIVEDTGDVSELYYQCRCGDFFMISCSELEEMGYKICTVEDEVSVLDPDALPSCVILPCGSCSLKIRLLINMDSIASVDGKSLNP